MRNRRIFCGILALTLTLAAGLSFAGSGNHWIHVRVAEDNGERVNVNIPLQLVESILPTIQTDEFSGGKIALSQIDLDGFDLGEFLNALRESPDADFITVHDDNESVKVSKENGLLLVRADDGDERVRVQIPLNVVDALIGNDGQELDLIAGLRALAEYDGGDLVTVESDDTSVRIWIDGSEAGE